MSACPIISSASSRGGSTGLSSRFVPVSDTRSLSVAGGVSCILAVAVLGRGFVAIAERGIVVGLGGIGRVEHLGGIVELRVFFGGRQVRILLRAAGGEGGRRRQQGG